MLRVQLFIEAELLQAALSRAGGAHHKYLTPFLDRLFHGVLHGQGGGYPEVRHLAEVKHHRPHIADGVVLAGDGFRHPEDHGAVELEQQHLALALIEQGLLVIREQQITITGADRLNALALQGAHLVDGEDVGDEHADADGGDQIHQHGERDHQIHDQGAADRDAVRSLEEAPVDDVDTHLERDAGKHGLGNLGRHAGEGQDHHHQDHGPADAREGAAAAGLDVHHRAHGGAGTGDATEQARRDVAEALADQFLVGIVLCTGDAVGHHCGEQGIDAAEHAEHGGIDQHPARLSQLEVGHAQLGEARGDFADAANLLATSVTAEQGEGEHCACNQGNQLGWSDFFDRPRGEPEDGQGDQSQTNLGQACVLNQLGQGVEGADHAALGDGLTEEGTQLQDDQDDADAAHEARDHRVGHLGDVAAQLQEAEGDLEHTREHHHGESHGQAVLRIGGGQAGDDGGHHHRHRPGGLGNQGGGTAEQSGKQSHQHGTPEPGGGAGPGGHTEGEGHRQGDDCSGDAAEEISLDVVGADVIQHLQTRASVGLR